MMGLSSLHHSDHSSSHKYHSWPRPFCSLSIFRDRSIGTVTATWSFPGPTAENLLLACEGPATISVHTVHPLSFVPSFGCPLCNGQISQYHATSWFQGHIRGLLRCAPHRSEAVLFLPGWVPAQCQAGVTVSHCPEEHCDPPGHRPLWGSTETRSLGTGGRVLQMPGEYSATALCCRRLVF